MRLCARFKKHFTPFLLAPFLSLPIAAATWFVTAAAGVSPLYGQIATVSAFVIFAGIVMLYVNHCLSRYPCNNQHTQ